MIANSRRRRLFDLSSVAPAGLAFALGAIVFFWPTWRSGLQLLPGDIGDTRFLNAILEHWWLTVRGLEAWRDMSFFFPQRGVLGYSEALLLMAPPYVAQRAVRMPLLYAHFTTILCVLLVGYLAMLWWLRRVLGLSLFLAIVGGLAFAFSNVNAMTAEHSQLYAAAFVPLLLGWLWRFSAGMWSGDTKLRAGMASAVVAPLLLTTSFYIGWFTALLLLIWSAILLTSHGLTDPAGVGQLARNARRHARLLLVLVAIATVCLLPFLALYVPVYRETGSREWPEVLSMLPAAVDLVNVGSNNVVWGWLARRIIPQGRPLGHELTMGMPITTLVTFVTAIAFLIASRPHDKLRVGRRVAIIALGFAVLLSWLVMLRFGDMSAWHVIYALVPGADAVRAVFRYQAVLQIAVISVVGYGLNELALHPARRLAVIVLGALLLLEQVNVEHRVFDARRESAWMARVQPAPSYCREFVVDPEGVPVGWRPTDALQIDAILIAQRTGVPTINGHSGNHPQGWYFRDVRAPGYAAAAVDWLANRRVIEGLCLLDLKAGSWWPARSSEPELHGVNLITFSPTAVEDAMAVTFTGFLQPESGGRWTNGFATMRLTVPLPASRIIIEGRSFNPNGTRLRVRIDDRTVADEALIGREFRLDIPHAGQMQSIELASGTFVPQVLGMNADSRQLGVVISRIEVR